MPTPITHHVHALTAGRDTPITEPFWGDFDSLLRAEWRRQKLRGQPPALLGYFRCATWRDAWDDLRTDCYLAAVLERACQLRTYPAGTILDPMVRLNIRHYLDARRAGADPVGASVYRRLVGALQRLVKAGELAAQPLRAGQHFTRATMLTFPCQKGAAVSRDQLDALLRALPSWSGLRVLLACTRRSPALPGRLAEGVRALGRAGCTTFRLLDLVELTQAAARATARRLLRARPGTPPV